MKYPIPEDWNGTDWCRFSICWPNSPFWISFLQGFVTYFTRGRAWDEKTGVIKDAQAIGWEIANNNLPLQEVAMTCQDANNVAKALLVLTAAVSGTTINFASIDLDEFLSGSHDFQSLGLANRIGPGGSATSDTTISARLDQLRTSIDALEAAVVAGGGGEDLEDDIANIWKQLEGIVTILGGTPPSPPDPL